MSGDDITLLEALSASGDVGIWALLGLLWRFDRRLLAIELFIANLKEKKHERLA